MTHPRQTVLLVDDDPSLLAALRRSFHGEPYDLLLAETADAALWLLSTRAVDVLVSDHHMPGMSGSEFLARVRTEHPAVVSIMLTGHADVDTAMSAINRGEVYRFFTKPCEAAALGLAIRQALQLKTLIWQARRLLETVRRRGGVDAPHDAPDLAAAGDDDLPHFEADDSPTDLGALLREIEEELAMAEHRDALWRR